MSDNGLETPPTTEALLETRYNEYIANLEYNHSIGLELNNEALESFEKRFKTFEQALTDKVTEDLLNSLNSAADLVTEKSISEILAATEERISKLSGTTQPVYREVRDTVKQIYSKYLGQHEFLTTNKIKNFRTLSDAKFLALLDRIPEVDPTTLNNNFLTELQESLQRSEEGKADLEATVKKLQSEITNLIKESEERDNDFSTKANLERDLNTLRVTLTKREVELSDAETIIDNLRREVSLLTSKVHTTDELQKRTSKSLVKVQNQFDTLQETNKNLREEKRAAEQKLATTVQQLRAEITELFEENQKLERENQEEKVKTTEAENRVQSLTEELSIATHELNQNATKLIDLQTRLSTLATGDPTSTASLGTDLRATIESTFAAQKRSLENEVARLIRELQSAQRVVTNYEATTQAQATEITNQKTLYRDEVLKRITLATQSEAQIDQLTAEIAQLQQQLESFNSASNPSDDSDMASTEFTKKLGELFSREDKKLISVYRGHADDGEDADILGWFKEAERVGNNNNWDNDQRLRFFSDRLKSEAMDWHIEYMNTVKNEGRSPTYQEWKKEMIIRFRDESDIERLRSQLRELRQKPDSRVRTFVAKLNNLYDLANGKTVAIPPTVNSSTTEGKKVLELYESNKKLRDEDKKKIFMKGLLPKIKDDIWARLPKNPTYDDVCEAAYTAESVVLNKELGEDRSINAVLAGMTIHESKQDAVIATQTNEIVKLKEQVNNLQTVAQDCMEPNLVAAVRTWEPNSNQPNTYGRPQRTNWSEHPANRGQFYGRENRPSAPRPDWNNNRSRENSRERPRVPYTNRQGQLSTTPRTPYRFNSQPGPSNFAGSIRGRGNRDTPNRTCFNCGKRGHIASQCWAEKQPREVQRERERQVQSNAQQRREQRGIHQNVPLQN